MIPASIPSRSLRATAVALALAIAACGGGEAPPATPAAAGDPAAPSRIEPWTLPPTLPGSAAPSLSATPDGKLLLGWINSQKGRRHIFQFSSFAPDWGRWMHAMTTVAVGNSLFVNWADVPHLAATPDGALWAHWLQKNGDAPYAYDVVLSRSRDGGANWAPPVLAHDDGTRTEHGFVSLWPQGTDALGVAWLDGRQTAAAAQGQGGHDHGPVQGDGGGHAGAGAMTLRAAVFDAQLQPRAQAEIDASVCDCCQTSVAITARGPLLVYRGRREGEIRDIYATRFDGNAWRAPQAVNEDGWVMPACPVNGPDVAADGERVVVAWYTAADGAPEVRIAASGDAGDRFSAALTLDRGEAVLGRAAVALDARQAWILWQREEAGRQSLWLSRRSPDLATEYERIEIAQPRGEGRATGFPQLAVVGGVAHVVWTDVAAGAPNLAGVRVVPAG